MGLIEALYGTPGEKQPAKEKYLTNTSDNRALYQKSYMIEFYSANEGEPEDVFTFSVPPENEELHYTQRKTETKTFGGLHVDEYGADAVKVVLSGSTINQSLKMIYRAGIKENMWLSGEEEIYYFRDLLAKYRSLENLRKPSRGKIIIYDLSKLIGHNSAGNWVSNYWQAFPGNFKISRASDKPFTYKYSFEFTGIPCEMSQEFNSHDAPPKIDKGKIGIIQELLNAIKDILGLIAEIGAWIDNIFEILNNLGGLLDLLDVILSFAVDLYSAIIDLGVKIVDGVNKFLSIPNDLMIKFCNIGLELQNETKRLVVSTASLCKTCQDLYSEDTDYWATTFQEYGDKYNLNNDELSDSINRILNDIENTTDEICAAAKSSDMPEVTMGNPDPDTGNPQIVLSYGSIAVMLKDTDSLESLAVEYLGDPNKAIDIALYNGVASLDELKPGDIILIPVLTRTAEIANNLIFARREDKDNYGRDILLTGDGNIVASNSGDYELAEGTENLSQAILLRLRESVNKRIRLISYGIRTNISDPTAGVAFILSSIHQTVMGDPRVLSVDDIQFKGERDSLIVNVFYTDINNVAGNVAGRV